MIEQKEYYTRRDIENYMKNSEYSFCIYNSLKELEKAENLENLKQYGIDFDDIYEFTDHMFKPENSGCYTIKGNIYPDDEYGLNIFFINYNKDDIPTAMYIDSPWSKGLKDITIMVNISLKHNNK